MMMTAIEFMKAQQAADQARWNSMHESSEEEVIDADYDPTLTRVAGGIPFMEADSTEEVCTKIDELDIRLSMGYSRNLKAWAIKVKGYDNSGHAFQGWFAADNLDDKQGIFPEKEWKIIQENRKRLVEMISPVTGGSSGTDSDPIGQGGELSSSAEISMSPNCSKKVAGKVESCVQKKKAESCMQPKISKEEALPKMTKKLSKEPVVEHGMFM